MAVHIPANTSMTKDQRRAAMPLTAEVIDLFRAEFGEPAAIRATEGEYVFEWRRK